MKPFFVEANMDNLVQMLSGRELDRIRRHGRSKRYDDIRAGVLVPPVARGPRDKRYPANEIAAIQAAEISGASVEERRKLVQKLLAARKKRAAVLAEV
jgi:hypothetical protein